MAKGSERRVWGFDQNSLSICVKIPMNTVYLKNQPPLASWLTGIKGQRHLPCLKYLYPPFPSSLLLSVSLVFGHTDHLCAISPNMPEMLPPWDFHVSFPVSL